MFDIGFFELLLVGVVGLVVLGPDKLSVTAKTIGKLAGKAKRQFDSIREEVAQSETVQELKQIQEDIEQEQQYASNKIGQFKDGVNDLFGSQIAPGQAMPDSLRAEKLSNIQTPEQEAESSYLQNANNSSDEITKNYLADEPKDAVSLSTSATDTMEPEATSLPTKSNIT